MVISADRGSKMKHYIEIQRLRTQDVVVDDTLTLEKTRMHLYREILSVLLRK